MKFFELLKLSWKLSGAEVEIDHVLRYLKKYNQDQDAIFIMRNLKLELKQEWNDRVREWMPF